MSWTESDGVLFASGWFCPASKRARPHTKKYARPDPRDVIGAFGGGSLLAWEGTWKRVVARCCSADDPCGGDRRDLRHPRPCDFRKRETLLQSLRVSAISG